MESICRLRLGSAPGVKHQMRWLCEVKPQMRRLSGVRAATVRERGAPLAYVRGSDFLSCRGDTSETPGYTAGTRMACIELASFTHTLTCCTAGAKWLTLYLRVLHPSAPIAATSHFHLHCLVLPGQLSPGTDTDAINFIGNDNLSSDPPNTSNQHAKTSVKNDCFSFHSGIFGVSHYQLTTKISKKDHCEIV